MDAGCIIHFVECRDRMKYIVECMEAGSMIHIVECRDRIKYIFGVRRQDERYCRAHGGRMSYIVECKDRMKYIVECLEAG